MKTKILYIHNSIFDNEGANRIQVAHMCKALAAHEEVSVGLLASGKDRGRIYSTYNFPEGMNLFLVKPIKNYYRRSWILFNKFRRLSKSVDNIYTRDLFVAYLIAKFYPKKKVIYELHEMVDNVLWELLFRNTLPKLHHLVTISHGLKKELSSYSQISDKDSTVLHDGVDLSLFDVPLLRHEIREELGLPSSKQVVMYLGSLANWKGYRNFLGAAKLLSKNEFVQFVLVGGKEEYVYELKKEFPFVHFVPRVPSQMVPKYQKAADILVLPNSGKFTISTTYTSPLKLFEYMASRRPIVASDLPSLREVVDESSVVFFRPDDSKDLADKIVTLIGDRDKQESLATQSYKKVKAYMWYERASVVLHLFKSKN